MQDNNRTPRPRKAFPEPVQRRMNKSERIALRKLINYCWESEKKHFEEQSEESKKQHIFREILTLNKFLKSTVNENE